MVDPMDELPKKSRIVIAYIKEGGITGIAFVLVAFYLGQQAGWISNVDRMDHIALIEETRAQTVILTDNQRTLRESVNQAQANQAAFMQLARVICISSARTPDLQQWCLGENKR